MIATQTAQPSWSLLSFRSFVLLPYFILIIAGLTVPSDGGHGILSLKSLAFLATVSTVSLYLTASQKLSLSQFKILCFLLCSLTFLLAWMMISLAYGETPTSSAWDQFKICWLTVSVVAISVFVVTEKLISYATLLKTIIFANCVYSTFKVGLVLLHLMGIIHMWSIVDALGIRFMSMSILGGMPRLQTSIDIATPFLLFFFLQGKQLGITWNKRFRYFYLAVSIFAIFLSFSRFLMFVAALSFFLHFLTLQFRILVRALPIFLIACVVGLSLIGFDNVYMIVERRLFSNDNHASDQTRIEQVDALMEEHQQFPVFGKGLGGFAAKSIRDGQIMHSYEVQWVAFLMQFGLIGIVLVLLPMGMIVIKILTRPLNGSKIGLFVLFLSWLFSGFTNPFLISLTSGILYTVFLLGGKALLENHPKDNETH